MYDKPSLSLDQVQRAMSDMLAKANEEPEPIMNRIIAAQRK